MKVEYSYYGKNPSLVIKGSDFISACADVDEKYLLETAIEGFAANFNVNSHFCDDVNNAILNRLNKSDLVIYTIKDEMRGRSIVNEWCEVYIQQGAKLTEIVISEDCGRSFSLNRTKS